MAQGVHVKDEDQEMQDQDTSKIGDAVQKALVVVREPSAAAPLVERLTEAGFIVESSSNPSLSLEKCRQNTPNLVVVEEDLASMSGIRFIADLLKVSWTTATILVSQRDDEAIHEATEGLGILGHIQGYEDFENLRKLMKKLEAIS